MKQISLLWVLVILTYASRTAAHYRIPETEKVPIQRLFTNLQQRLKANTNDVELTYQLARLYSMAYATNLTQVVVVKESSYPDEWQTRFSGLPKTVQEFQSPEARTVGLAHLTNAVVFYEHALTLLKTATNAAPWRIVRAELGKAWCLDQLGQRDQALTAYRKALQTAWHMEVTGDFDFKEWVADAWSDVKAGRNPIRSHNRGSIIMVGECYCEEIIGYMKKLLDPTKDARELAGLQEKEKRLKQIGRAITPILVPLEAETSFAELVNPTAGVEFDLDGSGLKRKWGWITPKAAWLVYDSDGSGQITSALQMFGNVTFWIFWQDGYAALAALDDNHDGMLTGPELEHLALWQDGNNNGVSDPGEVLPLAHYGITGIQTTGRVFNTTTKWNSHGVTLKDGTTRPTYDWSAPLN
ncbi:MAG: hypothetical protein M9920_10065 [Verrucomicrobiae bacterium]|nr:hypothetical protein [Verrucomicrobiae bacterium]